MRAIKHSLATSWLSCFRALVSGSMLSLVLAPTCSSSSPPCRRCSIGSMKLVRKFLRCWTEWDVLYPGLGKHRFWARCKEPHEVGVCENTEGDFGTSRSRKRISQSAWKIRLALLVVWNTGVGGHTTTRLAANGGDAPPKYRNRHDTDIATGNGFTFTLNKKRQGYIQFYTRIIVLLIRSHNSYE